MKYNLENNDYNISGIYSITNTINGKKYIGRAVCLRRRFIKHINTLQSKTHRNSYLLREYLKYGKDAFVFEAIEYATKEFLVDIEQKYLDEMKNKKNRELFFYNISFLSVGPGNCLTDASRKKISKTLKGHKHSQETLEKIKATSPWQPKKFVLIDKFGTLYNVNGIRDFSVEHNIHRSYISALVNKKIDLLPFSNGENHWRLYDPIHAETI